MHETHRKMLNALNFQISITSKLTHSVHLDSKCICHLRPNLGLVHYLRDLQISFFSKIFINNESHGTIHIFKNYFTTVFSVFNNKKYINRPIECVLELNSRRDSRTENCLPKSCQLYTRPSKWNPNRNIMMFISLDR